MTSPVMPPALPAALAQTLADYRASALSRRSFLTRATALGLSIPLARAFVGEAQAETTARPAVVAQSLSEPHPNRILRTDLEARPCVDPRLAEFNSMTNFTRGWLEYLVEYEEDGSLRPILAQSWQVNDDATSYVIELRQGVTWNNGDPFTAEDVLYNFARWCDSSVAGNSMPARLTNLIDPASGQLADGAVIIEGPHRLRLQLSGPDIALMVSLADFPAALVHRDYDGGDPALAPLGTGPYLPELNEPGKRQVLRRNDSHIWWGDAVYGPAYMERIEYIDFNADPIAIAAAARDGRIDMTNQSVGPTVPQLDALGWNRFWVVTAATLTMRFNTRHAPYDRLSVRQALTLAVDNAVVLELGYDNNGLVAENHHVCPIQPDYAPLPHRSPDPAKARALLAEEGLADFEFELISPDDAWQSASCDAAAAQLQDAGIKCRRVTVSSREYALNWRDYPFSATEWNMRPLGVQIMALAYRSNSAWNETGFSNAEFDALLAKAMAEPDANIRRSFMARMEEILQNEAVIIQPYWRALYRHASPDLRGVEMHPTLEHHHARWRRVDAAAEVIQP